MYSLFHMPSATFLTGFVLLLQAPFNQASGAHPSESAQKTQTLILPFYLKPEPLSEKKLVFRRSLSSFPFYEKNPRIHHFVREYSGLTFDEGVSLFVQRNALGQTPGDVCARLHELTALMQHRNMKSRQWSSCLTGFLENAFLRTYSFRYAPIDLEALSLCALIELEMEDGCPSSLRTRILKIWETAAISMEKGNTRQKKLASLLFIRTLQHGKEDHYLMARCGYRLANLYIRLKEPQKAQWAASFIPPIRGMEDARSLIQKWTTPPSKKKKRRK